MIHIKTPTGRVGNSVERMTDTPEVPAEGKVIGGFKGHDGERREDQAQIELGKKARKVWLLAALAAGALALLDNISIDHALHRHHGGRCTSSAARDAASAAAASIAHALLSVSCSSAITATPR